MNGLDTIPPKPYTIGGRQMKFKCNHNANIVTVFFNCEGQNTHIANIDLRSNRLYTTHGGYEMLADNAFKSNHVLQFLDFDDLGRDWTMNDLVSHKFDAVVMFRKDELKSVIDMCSREYAV